MGITLSRTKLLPMPMLPQLKKVLNDGIFPIKNQKKLRIFYHYFDRLKV
ncbi:hypothetical protein Lepto7375DRAFT_0377 [Leptolyngbya sp. PCC 7375]|nr:hypothetical protein Lepto7375DRAFT_0377 [Leptolyngbya sp. PCC 7375]